MVTDGETEIRHGTKIGRFVVTGELGKGGMGVVYAAHDRQLDRHVALKVLRAAAATDEERMRMLREGQAMARVTHPNVITVYEVGVEGSVVFLAQELLDGGTLGSWLETRRTPAEIIAMFVAAGRGLAAAHAAGLVHRDFKPDNVLLGKDGRVRVADFGLARALGTEDTVPAATRANVARAQLDLSRSPMSALTRTGAVMGTPMFMAPEQHLGEPADERSDQFSFCVALYQALYGQWPFAGKTSIALADAVISGRLEQPPRGAQIPVRLQRLLERGLSTDPANRYPSIDALLADLSRPPSRAGRRIATVTGVLVLAAGAVVGGYALRTRDEPTHPPIATFDPNLLATGGGGTWLASAIERGQLDNALQKYEMATALSQQSANPAQTSIARSSSALVLVLRGHLDEARAHLRDALTDVGIDPMARAYADLANAALGFASGDLAMALKSSAACARGFTPTTPDLAALCFEVQGDTRAAQGDLVATRKAYSDGLAIARRPEQRRLGLELALAAVDLGAVTLQEDVLKRIVSAAGSVQEAASDLGESAIEAEAWLVVARAQLALAASQEALDAAGHVKPASLEPLEIKLAYQIVTGQAQAVQDDLEGGLQRIDAARADAEKAGFPGLALAARLARVTVMVTLKMPDAAREQGALIEAAGGRGYAGVEKLAETIADR